METEGLPVLSIGQQTPGTNKLLKHNDCLSLVRSSNSCGQLLRSWHFPGPPSAVVHTDGADSLSLLASSSCCWCWIGGACVVEDVIVCLNGSATPRTKGAMLSVTLRPRKSERFGNSSFRFDTQGMWNWSFRNNESKFYIDNKYALFSSALPRIFLEMV